jgi:8-hydroxy-5-deazaflavin:NADPH oxidoreductase
MSINSPRETIAVIGGAGKEGGGLALRLAHAGYSVIVGSRDTNRSIAAARDINAACRSEMARGSDNAAAADQADIVILAVPYSAQRTTAEALKPALLGKILVDVTVPLVPPKVSRVTLPEGGSAVTAIQAMLGADVRVVSAFQNISAHHLKDLGHAIDCDVLVCADDRAAGDRIVDLAREIGMGAWNIGALANSVVSETLTSALIALNQRYKVPAAGIRITGMPETT